MESSVHRSESEAANVGLPWPVTDTSLVSRFEECAKAFGPQLALSSPGGAWSYDSLNRAANRLARRILSVRPNGSEPVALLLEESFDFLVASLAVLKAGKFYLPLDPSFPNERNTYIMRDGEARLLITSTRHLEAAREMATAESSVMAFDEPAATQQADADLGLEIPLDSAAMLIYTSGSTGRPKGVLHSHRGLAQNAMRQNDLLAITPADRCTMLYSTSVMGMTRDVYNALLHGASLHRFDLRQDGLAEMVGWIAENRITVLHTISSVFRRLDDVLESSAGLESIRLVILGGEEVLRLDVELLRRFFPADCRLFTGLGLSETGTIRANLLSRSSSVESSILPIGYPVRGVEILLLGEDGRPVPPGEIGEIAVRSEYMALDYWHAPAGSGGTFIPDPEGGEGRLFLTGDLGRFLPDGALVHCGRKDFQVKMRGFRIELLEVEAAILETGRAADAAAMVYEVGPGDKRLVAFVVLRPGQTFDTEALRAPLSEKLPEHMLPSLFIPLASLPLTPNGKIDRKSLPQPDFGLQASADELPRNDTEAALIELWKEALSVSMVGRNDRFFDLGGNSLIAGTLLARLSRQFGRDYPLSILAQYDTVEKMAALLQDPGSGHTRPLVAVRPEGTRPPLFVIPGGFGDALYLRHLARHLDPEQPLYGLQAGMVEGQAGDLPSVGDIAGSYISEIRKIQPAGPYLIAGHSFGGYVALEMARLLRAAGQTVALLGMLDTYPPGPRRQARWTDRLHLHWDNLRGRDWRSKIGYLRERALDSLPRLLKYRRLAKWLGLGQLGRKYRIFVSRNARYTYLPDPYPGKAILVKAMERDWYVHWDPMETWPRFVPDLQILEVEGTHRQIMFEPYIQQVARHLNLAIRQALPDAAALELQPEAEPATRED